MTTGMEKRVRFLEAYAVVSSLLVGVLVFTGAAQTKQSVTELSVERLNVVEKNGQLRAVIANSDRMPDPVVNGRTFKAERPPGMIFYNGIGDECGGLIFGAAQGGGKYGAYGGLSFDQYKQSQAVAITYNDHSGRLQTGLSVWDRPETPIVELLERQQEVARLAEGPEKTAARKRLDEMGRSPTRVFVGKTTEKEATVRLYDAKGTARVNLVVDPSGEPRLDFLGSDGTVVMSLPRDLEDLRTQHRPPG